MRRSLLAAAMTGLLLVNLGCAQWVGSMRRAMRAPGERLVDLPDRVARDYDCDERSLPFFQLEAHQVNPIRVNPGTEFNHHVVYVLCPVAPTEVVTGRLVTRIRFKGEAQVIEEVAGYEMKPGRWAVDAFVRLPGDAESGVYALELVFESEPIQLEERITFGVEAP